MQDLCSDVKHFIDAHSDLQQPILIGHSMGARTAMRLALTDPDSVRAVVSIDAVPASYTHNHGNLFDTMNKLDLSAIQSREQAQRMMTQISDLSTRAFVGSNLVLINGKWQWRINKDVLEAYEHHIHNWDAPYGVVFPNKVLFIGGTRFSRLTTPEYLQSIPSVFPNHEIFYSVTASRLHPHQSLTQCNERCQPGNSTGSDKAEDEDEDEDDIYALLKTVLTPSNGSICRSG